MITTTTMGDDNTPGWTSRVLLVRRHCTTLHYAGLGWAHSGGGGLGGAHVKCFCALPGHVLSMRVIHSYCNNSTRPPVVIWG